MTTPQDDGGTAQISATDFEQMKDEMNRLRDQNEELLGMVKRCEMWLSTASEGRRMQNACKAVIAKAVRKEGA